MDHLNEERKRDNGREEESQGRAQNLKEVPLYFTEVFNIDDVAANGVIRRNQHRKEKKLEFHSNHWC